MKKFSFVFVFLALFSVQDLLAQREKVEYLPNFDKRTLRFGFYLGGNQLGYKIDYKNMEQYPPEQPPLQIAVKETFGFNVGFLVDLRLHDNIHLHFEPGLMSNAKTLTFYNVYTAQAGNPNYTGTENTERKVTSTLMHLPLLLKISANRMNNLRPYLIGGASYDYNFSSNANNPSDNYDGEFRTTTHNFMYEVGVGMDFYFYFFKFSPSVRFVSSINNELMPDNIRKEGGIPLTSPWTGPIDYFGTRGIYLNLTFQ